MKVYSVYGRNGYQGPWTFLNWYTKKADANRAAERERYMWTERRVLAEFDYEAKARRSGG